MIEFYGSCKVDVRIWLLRYEDLKCFLSIAPHSKCIIDMQSETFHKYVRNCNGVGSFMFVKLHGNVSSFIPSF